MRVESLREDVSVENGVVQIAFDLSGSEAGYLVISTPEIGGGAEDEFFGSDHHVEVRDQLHGRYGGLIGLTVRGLDQVEITLLDEVPEVGSALVIHAPNGFSEPVLKQLQTLARSSKT